MVVAQGPDEDDENVDPDKLPDYLVKWVGYGVPAWDGGKYLPDDVREDWDGSGRKTGYLAKVARQNALAQGGVGRKRKRGRTNGY